MSTIERMDQLLNESIDPDSTSEENGGAIVQLADGQPDPRLIRMSYSSEMLFNGCPRKYQLTKLSANKNPEAEEDWQTSLTFQFGHTVGEAIQDTLTGVKSRDRIVFDLFRSWKRDLFEENEKQKKSFFHALLAIHQFWEMRDAGFYEDYEVAIYDGKPAAELSFRIKYPNGTTYRGFVDLVLRNKYTGEYVILEIKTNSGNVINPNQYKNSEQAIGYSVVLDKIEPGLTNYTVEYLVRMTRLQTWEPFSFPKTYVQRALWLKDRLWTAQLLELLVQQEGNHGIWPMRGNHCMNFNRACDFLGICHMSTESLVKPLREIDLTEETDYQFEFNLEDLL